MIAPTMEGTWILMFLAIGAFFFALWYIIREFRSSKTKYNAKSIIHLMMIEERDDAKVHKESFKNKPLELSGDDTVPGVELGKIMYASIGDQFIKFFYKHSIFKWKRLSVHYASLSGGLDSNKIVIDARTIRTINREAVAVPSSDATKTILTTEEYDVTIDGVEEVITITEPLEVPLTWDEVREAFLIDRVNNTMGYTITFLSDQSIKSVIEASTARFKEGESSVLKDFDIQEKMTKLKEGINADN